MRDMQVNQASFTVTPKKRKHPGFVDCEGNELEPGDTIAVGYYGNRVHTGIITRFTPRRAYYIVQYLPPMFVGNGNNDLNSEWFAQLPAGWGVRWKCFGPHENRMLPMVLKVDGAEV